MLLSEVLSVLEYVSLSVLSKIPIVVISGGMVMLIFVVAFVSVTSIVVVKLV